MAKEPGIGLTTKTVLHFLNIKDDRMVTLITNEVDVKFVLLVMLENDLNNDCLKNKKLKVLGDSLIPFDMTAITFE